jgi:hypothetical protein
VAFLDLTPDQIRIAYQADAFLTHLINEKLADYCTDTTQFSVALDQAPHGVLMSVGAKACEQMFIVRRKFQDHISTSAIFNDSTEMVDELRRSIEAIFRPVDATDMWNDGIKDWTPDDDLELGDHEDYM